MEDMTNVYLDFALKTNCGGIFIYTYGSHEKIRFPLPRPI